MAFSQLICLAHFKFVVKTAGSRVFVWGLEANFGGNGGIQHAGFQSMFHVPHHLDNLDSFLGIPAGSTIKVNMSREYRK